VLSAFRRAEQFRGDSAVTTWLHRIVVNASLDRLRRRSVRATRPLPDDDDQLPGAVVADPMDAMSRRETQMVIIEALAELPAEQRDAVLLVDVEGWSVEDAAVMLNCPEGTVKSRCSRGRSKLAKRLAFLRNPDESEPVVTAEGGEEPRE
jgi:RNA polymerase sigma-70 factor (ECF subfamily)